MSARAFHRILKVACTIAEMEGAPEIETHDLAKAVRYDLCALSACSAVLVL